MKNLIFILIFPIMVSAQTSAPDAPLNSLSDLPMFKEAKDAIENPNFPLSDSEVRELFKKIDKLAPHLQSASDIEYKWITSMPTPHYDLYETKLVLAKMVSGFDAVKISKSKAKLAKFKAEISGVIAHEYGHALLNKNLISRSPNIALLMENLQLRNKTESTADNNITGEMRPKTFLFLAYHELFADTVAYLHTKDPDSTKNFLRSIFGSTFGTLYERRFTYPQSPNDVKKWRSEMKNQVANDMIDPYSLLWPQRSVIKQLVDMKRPSGEILELLIDTIVSESAEWNDELKIDPKAVNTRFAEKLIKKSTRSCEGLFL